MGITTIARKFFAARQKELQRHQRCGAELQEGTLGRLMLRGAHCEYGRGCSVGDAKGYADFAKRVPVADYETLKGHIERMRHGERDVLWPGRAKWFAKSSGTTNDKSKFIPVTAEGLQRVHYRGGRDCVAMYLGWNPGSRMFDGKGLILGGSHQPNYDTPHSLVGDLSSILIENINPIVNLVRVPDKKTALMADFEAKREAIARQTAGCNVTNISGVPSWMLSVLRRVLDVSGADTIKEVWPGLEVFFHGGIAFTPYREIYRQLMGGDIHYMETYNASEGFFGIQDDPADKAMLLMLDYDVFYEFIPLSDFGTPGAEPVPLWGVETGVNYAMLITTSCGLWRYSIGDTVMFTSKDPYKFVITGRTKYFINAFGEELIQDNAEKALAHACRNTGAKVGEYTAAPVFMDGEGRCRHQWLIEFDEEPVDIAEFSTLLDVKLKEVNSDYEAKRSGDVTLQAPEVVKARKGLFEDWLKSKGKLGGQHKVPRLSNTRTHMDELLALNSNPL